MGGRHTRQQRVEIGRAVIAGRGAGVSWAVLQQVYQRERTTLWRYMRDAQSLRGGDVSCETIHISPDTLLHMQHPAPAD